ADDMTNKTDQRLTLAADDSSSDRLGRKALAHLVISCGDMFRTNGHRAMIFDAGMPIRASGNAGGLVTYVDYLVRTDTDNEPENKRAQFVDAGHTMLYVP